MSANATVLVHLSDVHFRKRRIDGRYDIDEDVRNELELDLATVKADVGEATGILVTGDIAFAAQPAEYQAAHAWLNKICSIAACSPASVWTAPGNHDIDRATVASSEVVKMVQRDLRADVTRLEHFQRDPMAAVALFQSLSSYNDFAAKYGCDVSSTRLAWSDDLLLNDGSTLRLCGLNSTLTSCHLDDTKTLLAMGDMSHALKREPGVTHLSLCHHPPDWMIDHDTVSDLLSARVALQLFGHKHNQRIARINDSVRVTAGAVHPDRSEQRWEPRYNVIVLQVARGASGKRQLSITVHARVWSSGLRFVPDTADPLAYKPLIVPLEEWTSSTPPVSTVQTFPVATSSPAAADGSPASRIHTMTHARQITYRFLTLPYHVRIELASLLGLMTDEDRGVPDRVLFERMFKRASDQGKLELLWLGVEQRHGGDVSAEDNPYKGH